MPRPLHNPAQNAQNSPNRVAAAQGFTTIREARAAQLRALIARYPDVNPAGDGRVFIPPWQRQLDRLESGEPVELTRSQLAGACRAAGLPAPRGLAVLFELGPGDQITVVR